MVLVKRSGGFAVWASIGITLVGAVSAFASAETKCNLAVFQGDVPSVVRYTPVSYSAANPFDDCVMAASLHLYLTEAHNETTGETFFLNEAYRAEIEKNTRVVITYILDDEAEFERVAEYLRREFHFNEAARLRHPRKDGRTELVLNYKKKTA